MTVEAVIACCCAQDECCAATNVAISTDQFSIFFRSIDGGATGAYTTVGAFGTVEQSIELNPVVLNGAGLVRFNAQGVAPFCRYQNQTPTSGFITGTPFLGQGRFRLAGNPSFNHTRYIVYRYAEPFRFSGFPTTRYEAGWLLILNDPLIFGGNINLFVAQIGDVGNGSCPFTAYDFGNQFYAETQYRGVPRIHAFAQSTGTQNLADLATSTSGIHFAYDAAGSISVT